MHGWVVLVQVVQIRGSAPREVGACMRVSQTATQGSVGGGHLEWQACAHARALLDGAPVPTRVRYALGANLGQCCGGEVVLDFARYPDAASALAAQPAAEQAGGPVAVFGAGHVGQALVPVLLALPMAVQWFDSRAGVLPGAGMPGLVVEQLEPLPDAVADLAAGTQVLILTHSHALDLELVAACLQRQQQAGDLAFVGLIGSATKWQSFRQRLRQRGFTDAALDQVTCPIGLAGIPGKQPGVIAVAVAAQLLQRAATPTR